MMNQPIRASRCPRYSGRTSDLRPGREDPPDVLAEVEEHGGLGADLDDRRERRAGVAPAEQLGEDPQVRAGGDRQELGEALDEAEHHGLQQVLHESHETLEAATVSAMQRRALGRTGLRVSRLGLGTMTWGGDTDEHEARDQLTAFLERRRHPRRHRGRLRRRRAPRSCSASLLGERRPARRGRHRDQGRRSRVRTGGQRVLDTSRGTLLRYPGRVAQAARGRPRRPVAGARLDRRDAGRGDALRRSTSRSRTGRAAYVGISNYSGWQTAPGGDLAARRARAGAAGLDPGRVLPAQPQRSRHEVVPAAPGPRARRSCPGRRSGGACSPASTAPASRRTRAAPPRSFGGFVEPYLDDRAARHRRGDRSRPPTGSAGRRSRSRWSGCGTGPASPRRSSAPAPRPSSRTRWTIEDKELPGGDLLGARRRLRGAR